MANTIESLDLYAKIEDMLSNEDAITSLYSVYLKAMDGLEFDSILDVGCGSGSFLDIVSKAFEIDKTKGIDLSPVMAQRAREIGVDAQAVDLCDLEGTYDVITAVFDMVNYLDADALERFGQCIYDHLENGGYFMCDINTKYGFDEIASGSFTAEDEQRFLVIDSDYDDGVYISDFTLFEKDGDLYSRSDKQIIQYLHSADKIAQATGLSLISEKPLRLYGEECDKFFLTLRKMESKP